MSERAAVLFANDAFYVAFMTRDIEAMEGLWAEVADISCIHPGWNVVSGRDAVIESWSAILSNPESPHIICRHATAHVHGDVAYVVCYETIGTSDLVATNVFLREDGAWRLIHHQAGITAQGTPEDDDEDSGPPQSH